MAVEPNLAIRHPAEQSGWERKVLPIDRLARGDVHIAIAFKKHEIDGHPRGAVVRRRGRDRYVESDEPTSAELETQRNTTRSSATAPDETMSNLR